MHLNCDFVDKTTWKRFVANQKGYRWQQNVSFQPNFVVELPVSLSRKSDRRSVERIVEGRFRYHNP
jgi:hypothetical protein